jgi:hypothetical protein
MKRLLVKADFAHAVPERVFPDGVLRYKPGDISRPEFFALTRRGTNNFISLTGAAHTREVYDRLPYGWRPSPTGWPTDAHMWQQIASLPGFCGACGTRVTAIHFPDPVWRKVDDASRTSALEEWLMRSLRPDWEEVSVLLLQKAIWRAAQDAKLRSIELSARLERADEELTLLRANWWRSVERRLAYTDPFKTLRERRRRVGGAGS